MSEQSSGGTEQPTLDEKQVLDVVQRKGPNDLDHLMAHLSHLPRSEVFRRLTSLKSKGYVGQREGDLFEDGTSSDIWYVDTETDGQGGDS